MLPGSRLDARAIGQVAYLVSGKRNRVMTSQQRKELRSLAHHLDPVVMIGKAGVTEGVVAATVKALDAHELIKVRFLEFKDEKKGLTEELAAATSSEVAGIIGHVSILYKEHPDADRRKIELS